MDWNPQKFYPAKLSSYTVISWQSQEKTEHYSVNCVTMFRYFLWTLGEEVGGGGEGRVPNYEYMFSKPESELLTGQAEYPQFCECLGSRLAMERSMMKSNTLCYTSPPLRLSTSHLMSFMW